MNRFILIIGCVGLWSFLLSCLLLFNISNDNLKFRTLDEVASITKPLSRPGDGGHPVILTREEAKEGEETFYLNQFNRVAARKVSLDRTLPDFRDSRCPSIDIKSLPTASLIVVFHNEDSRVVLRTAISCLNRAPSDVLKEVILVDDFSDRMENIEEISEFLKLPSFSKIRMVRTPSRHGLIRAKNYGSRFATASVFVFLDSHCECTEGWLPPFLSPIAKNHSVIVQPSIAPIDQHTFSFMHSTILSSQGVFNWNLLFIWRSIPPHDEELRSSPVDLIRSPTLAGGLFAIHKDWWNKLGRYDDGMELWGGENLELSFKSWMCGGQVVYQPCSHIGHVFRGVHPYKWYKDGPDFAFIQNAKRLAEVWLDEYKFAFYMASPIAKKLDMGDISEQLALKKRLNCHPFSWYLKNVVQNMYIPSVNFTAHGSVRMKFGNRHCLDRYNKDNGPPYLYECHHLNNQLIYLSTEGYLHFGIDVCLWAGQPEEAISMTKCKKSNSMLFAHNKESGLIVHLSTKQCITFDSERNSIFLRQCDSTNKDQQWQFQYYDS